MLWLAGLLSVLIGVTLGILGGGGSMLTLPILLYVLHIPPKSAIATSLLVVGSTSLLGALLHARAGRVRLRTGAVFGAAGMAGAYLGGRLAHFLPATVLILAFAGMMVVTGVIMIRGRRAPAAPAPTQKDHELPLGRVLLQGAGVGAVTGLVGAGGGFLVVPALVLLGGLPMPAAVGTSLLVIAMQSTAGVLGYLGHVEIDLRLGALVSGAAALGVLVGSRFAGRIREQVLRRAFGYFLLATAAFLLYKQLN
jgi:hypothetical protein